MNKFEKLGQMDKFMRKQDLQKWIDKNNIKSKYSYNYKTIPQRKISEQTISLEKYTKYLNDIMSIKCVLY